MMILKLPRENKERIISSIQTFFQEERSEEIGNIAAEQLLDFMIKQLGPHVYNQALSDARKAIQERMAMLDDDLYTMERPNK